ncbi:hypothetical protein BJV78DRAFT_1285673 [Lactifluus subvellereus]|nr:hypothetical protein BJV78DRAFT_1285673 [Lactifluus subvellereus]
MDVINFTVPAYQEVAQVLDLPPLAHRREQIIHYLSYESSVQLEQDFEIALTKSENINAAMKQDLPRFMTFATRSSFIHIITCSTAQYLFYLILDKISQFSEGKYAVDVLTTQIIADYENKRGAAAAVVEALSVSQRFISTQLIVKFRIPAVQLAIISFVDNRSFAGSLEPERLCRKVTSATTPGGYLEHTCCQSVTRERIVELTPPVPAPPPFGSGKTFTPLRPLPPYSPSAVVAAKRPPPLPLSLKPKPARVNYVVALYDFTAQAEGDLDFEVGDPIEAIERTDSTEDWWTGGLAGRSAPIDDDYVLQTLSRKSISRPVEPAPAHVPSQSFNDSPVLGLASPTSTKSGPMDIDPPMLDLRVRALSLNRTPGKRKWADKDSIVYGDAAQPDSIKRRAVEDDEYAALPPQSQTAAKARAASVPPMLAEFDTVIADYLLPSTTPPTPKLPPALPSKQKLGDFLDGAPDYERFAHAAVAEGVRIFETARNNYTILADHCDDGPNAAVAPLESEAYLDNALRTVADDVNLESVPKEVEDGMKG